MYYFLKQKQKLIVNLNVSIIYSSINFETHLMIQKLTFLQRLKNCTQLIVKQQN